MPTLYIRNVPESIVSKLKERARNANMSLSSFVNQTLEDFVSAPTNQEIIQRLNRINRTDGQAHRPTVEDIIDAVHQERR